jgi:hypothetical protein
MRFDLNLIFELCCEIGLKAQTIEGKRVEIDLGEGAVLSFKNAEGEKDDCIVGFLNTPWHQHTNFEFVDPRGIYVELDYLGVITGLADGEVLICERHVKSHLVDRWLIHRDYNDFFDYMEQDETIVVRRATTKTVNVSSVSGG